MTVVPHGMDGVAFTNAAGREAGLTDAVMRRKVFERPFHGVRVIGAAGRIDGGLIDRCAHLQTAIRADAVFSHATAARLWGIALPWHIDDALHVIAPGDTCVRRPGVVGWKTSGPLPEPALLHGLALTKPADTWVTLATMTESRGGRMPRDWLVAAADYLVSGRRTRYGREAPLSTMADLTGAVRRHGPRRGAASLSWALERVRRPVDSPRETLLRLGLVRARLPEPSVQPAVTTRVGTRHPDLGYLDHGVLIEYLGDVHRTDPDTWRQDLVRVQLFEDAGYRVIMTGADDVTSRGLLALSARVRRALHGGGPRGRE